MTDGGEPVLSERYHKPLLYIYIYNSIIIIIYNFNSRWWTGSAFRYITLLSLLYTTLTVDGEPVLH